ncbi:MAG: transcription antitermination factor NusB [Denitrobacterium sp.]|jgi:N utilization substance protein B|nr:transcription antitermination factor NusB [Denitrobacterium sp.]
MPKRHEERSVARRIAAQILYESEITGEAASDICTRDDAIPDVGALPAYALTLVNGVEEHATLIDDLLAQSSQNWAVDRMPIVDRAIMRIAVFEMVYCADVPVSVTINECVELAKQFGGEDESGSFVNGILGGIARKLDDPDFILPSELTVDELVAQGVLGKGAAGDEPACDAAAVDDASDGEEAPAEAVAPAENAADDASDDAVAAVDATEQTAAPASDAAAKAED